MMAVEDVVRPEGDDAPWSNDLDEVEDGLGQVWIGVEQARRQRRQQVDANGNLPPEVLREEIARALRGLE